jgi:hypothetical protein
VVGGTSPVGRNSHESYSFKHLVCLIEHQVPVHEDSVLGLNLLVYGVVSIWTVSSRSKYLHIIRKQLVYDVLR